MLAKLTIFTACLLGIALPVHADYLRIDNSNFSLRLGTPIRPSYPHYYPYHRYHIPFHHPQVLPAPHTPNVIVVPPGSTVIVTPDTRIIQRSHIGIYDRLHQIGHPIYQGF